MMKRLLVAAAFVPLLAHADTWEMPNQSGGKIVLNDSVCIAKGGKRYESLRSMFAVSGTGKTFSGCWYVADGWVRVIYEDNTEYTYPASSFTQIKSYQPKGTSHAI